MDLHERAQAIFDRVVDLDAREQARVLAEECGEDEGVRNLVEDLLALHQTRLGSFLEQPDGIFGPAGASAQDPSSDTSADQASGPGSDPASSNAMPEHIGRYRVDAELGRGGMGVVYSAQDERLGRRIAIKVLSSGITASGAWLEAIEREARLLASLNHPNIATVFSLEDEDGRTFITLEYISGETLRDRLRQGPLPVRETLSVGRQIARALEAAHDAGVIHRDLTPANVKINADGRVKILDFGISHRSNEGEDASFAGGTPGYMSPEHIQGERTGPAQDIWTFGCLFFECLTGTRAFLGNNTTELLRSTLLDDPLWSSLPEATPQSVRSLLRSCLRKEPSDRVTGMDIRVELEEQILQDEVGLRKPGSDADPDALAPPSLQSHNLPRSIDRFVGRARELEEIARRLHVHRHVTLIGIGGSGKSRLAIEAASRQQTHMPDGIWFVDVGTAGSRTGIALAFCRAIGLREDSGTRAEDRLVRHLGETHSLLVFDSCETALDACRELSQLLLTSCANLRILGTSRIATHAPGESVYSVPALGLPIQETTTDPNAPRVTGTGRAASSAEEVPSDAVELFLDRARLASPSFAASEEEMITIAEIVRQVDGIPLAVELAAARIRVLSPEQVLTRLNDRFRLLQSRTASDPRQRSLLSVIEWSHDQLEESERELLRRLSLFRGGWTLEAAEAICSGDGVDEWDVLDLLVQLVDKSLVALDPNAMTEAARSRYRMLDSVREFVESQVPAQTRTEQLRRQIGFFAKMATSKGETKAAVNTSPALWVDRLEAERDNLRHCLQASLDDSELLASGLELAAKLGQFWRASGYGQEGVTYYDEFSSTPLPSDAEPDRILNLAEVCSYAGDLTFFYRADFDRAQEQYERAIELYSALQLDKERLHVRRLIGWLSIRQGKYETARTIFQESLDESRRIDHHIGEAEGHRSLGSLANVQGRIEESVHHLEQALRIHKEMGNPARIADSSVSLGNAVLLLGDTRRARQHLEEALKLNRAQEQRLGVLWNLINLGIVDYWDEDYAASRKKIEEALAMARDRGQQFEEAITLGNLGILAASEKKDTEARALLEESIRIRRELGDRSGEATAATTLAVVLLRADEVEEARIHLRTGIETRHAMGELSGLCESLEAAVAFALHSGVPETAARVLGTAHALREQGASAVAPPARATIEERKSETRSALGNEEFERAFAEGRAMSREDAVRLCLEL